MFYLNFYCLKLMFFKLYQDLKICLYPQKSSLKDLCNSCSLQVAKDPVFVRDGADIYVDSHISFTKVRIDYLNRLLLV